MNCHRNYPWYRDWKKSFAEQDVQLVGIHTPETQAERSIESVGKRAKEAEIDFPVLVDNDNKNWHAWGNQAWPTVYVIDKRGYLRYWWRGELNWRDAGGQKMLKAKIEELLKEPSPGSKPK